MRAALTIILFFFGLSLVCQTKSKGKKKKEEVQHSIGSIDLLYGHKFFLNNFSNQLSNLSNYEITKPIDFIGFGLSSGPYNINARNVINAQYYFNYILPQNILLQDTINANIKGFSVNIGFGRSLSNKKRNVSLSVFLGFNSGYLKIVSYNSFSQLNPFFSPKLSLQPKFFIKRIVISLNFDFDYDISKSVWVKDVNGNSDLLKLQNYSSTGLSCFFGLGYRLY